MDPARLYPTLARRLNEPRDVDRTRRAETLAARLAPALGRRGAYRPAPASRALPGWTAAEIHTALNEPAPVAGDGGGAGAGGRRPGGPRGHGPRRRPAARVAVTGGPRRGGRRRRRRCAAGARHPPLDRPGGVAGPRGPPTRRGNGGGGRLRRRERLPASDRPARRRAQVMTAAGTSPCRKRSFGPEYGPSRPSKQTFAPTQAATSVLMPAHGSRANGGHMDIAGPSKNAGASAPGWRRAPARLVLIGIGTRSPRRRRST